MDNTAQAMFELKKIGLLTEAAFQKTRNILTLMLKAKQLTDWNTQDLQHFSLAIRNLSELLPNSNIQWQLLLSQQDNNSTACINQLEPIQQESSLVHRLKLQVVEKTREVNNLHSQILYAMSQLKAQDQHDLSQILCFNNPAQPLQTVINTIFERMDLSSQKQEVILAIFNQYILNDLKIIYTSIRGLLQDYTTRHNTETLTCFRPEFFTTPGLKNLRETA